MNKHYLFTIIIFGIVFLLIQFIIIGLESSERSEDLSKIEAEINSTNKEISRLTTLAKWWDTNAAKIYLKKLNTDYKLPWEKIIIIVPKIISWEYSINNAINDAKRIEYQKQQLSIPEKWNALFLWKKW